MKNAYRLNTFLAAVTGLVFLGYLLIQTYAPAAILPPVDLMLVSGLSLLALVLESYSGPRVERRVWPVVALLGGVTFALLPLAAGLVALQELLRFTVVSCVAFLVLTFLFTAICERLASGPAGRLAPLLSAGVLFLAVQGCSSLFL
ncbi:hypothetical protein [uncultured Flavonifractor sp.]|uniref:hypothetical protein n=1 Tax=uncultured Flavonifractor sp. TaxID=1193534 RepID=UPI00260F43C1|nr:hypothetical protein [uncultured Flavonifractor sp.]